MTAQLTFESGTSVPVARFKMRDYQVAANDALDAHWADKKRLLLCMVTGGGKTVIFAEQARRMGGVLVLAHRDALIKQAAQKLRHHTGEDVAIEKAEKKAYPTDYICASVQSLRGPRLEKFAQRHRPPLIVIDEAHRSAAKTYRDILAMFPEARVLGVTATPDRADGVGLWNVFQRVGEHGAAFQYDMRHAIDDAWLTDFDYRPVHAPIQLDKLKAKSNGDIDPEALDKAMIEYASEIAKALIGSCQGRTLGFTSGVQSAHVVAECLNRMRPGCARAVDGTMGDIEKEQATRAHQRGDFDYLINCAVYVEGYDDPGLINVFDAALTKSRARHAQKVGRGTRLAPEFGPDWGMGSDPMQRMEGIACSSKPRWNYFHLNGIGNKHDLATPVDLLAGTATDDERRVAKEILAAQGGSVDAAIDEARARLEEERSRLAAAARREAERRRVEIGDHRDPFALMHMQSSTADDTGEPASEAQRRRMLQVGYTVPDRLTKNQASRLISNAIVRQNKGLANPHEVRKLAELGIINGHRLSGQKARAILKADWEKRNGWTTRGNKMQRPEPGWDG